MVAKSAFSWDLASLAWEDSAERRRAAFLALADEDYFNPALLEEADPFLCEALWAVAQEVAPGQSYLDIEGTTTDFADEQGREQESFDLPPHLRLVTTRRSKNS